MNIPAGNNFNLIPIYEEVAVGDSIQTVNARELHAFLEVGKDFSSWVKDRIGQYGFEENSDYVVYPSFGGNPSGNLAPQNRGPSHGGRPRIDYHISLDMAKELSMVERNAKGKEARQYFIECERRAQKSVSRPAIDLSDPNQLLGLLGDYAERTKLAEAKIEYLEPKVAALDRLDTAEGNYTPRPASKILGYPERKLIKWMEANNWAFRQSGKGPLQAYVDKRNRGYLDHKLHSYIDEHTGETKTSIQMVITAKGMSRLAQVLPDTGGAA